MKSLEELTKVILRKAATTGQEARGRVKDDPSAGRAMVRRLMTKGKFREEDLGDVAQSAASPDLDTSELDRALTRAKAAVLNKTTVDGEDLSLSDRMIAD